MIKSLKIAFLSHSDMSIFYFRLPIMRALKARGHEVVAICPDGKWAKRVKSEFKVINYNNKNLLKAFFSIRKTIKKFDFIQTSAHFSNIFGASKKSLALVEGLGSIYVERDFRSRLIRFFLELAYKISLKKNLACIFVNDSDPNYFLSRNLIDKNKIRRVKSVGVDSGEFDAEKTKPYEFNTDKKVVMMISRALVHKGIREFYQAAEILDGKAKFVFVGSVYKGNKSSVNEEFLKSKFVEWIEWSDEVKELIKASFIFVLPSYKEGFPHTVLEAISMAKPCVVSDVSGCNEAVIDGLNGLTCKVKDAKDLAKKIEILLNDEKLALNLGQNGRKMVLENYDEKIIVQKYLEIYREFIDV